MKPDLNEFDFFTIDENKLDREWIAQPKLYFTYAEKLANARFKWEQTKAERDVIMAELDQKIRADPARYELPKITEGAVEKTIQLQKQYQAIHDAVLKYKHRMDVMQAVVEALDHRKKSLEMLVQLRLANYFSEPHGPKGVDRMEVEHATKRKRRVG